MPNELDEPQGTVKTGLHSILPQRFIEEKPVLLSI